MYSGCSDQFPGQTIDIEAAFFLRDVDLAN